MRLMTQRMLDYMRAMQFDNLVDTCTIHHYSGRTSDGYGGVTTTYTDEVDVPCRLWISSGPNGTSSEAHFYGDAEVNVTDAFLVLAWDQDISAGDRITYDNRLWEVAGFQSNDTWVTAKRVRLSSLRPSQD